MCIRDSPCDKKRSHRNANRQSFQQYAGRVKRFGKTRREHAERNRGRAQRDGGIAGKDALGDSGENAHSRESENHRDEGCQKIGPLDRERADLEGAVRSHIEHGIDETLVAGKPCDATQGGGLEEAGDRLLQLHLLRSEQS